LRRETSKELTAGENDARHVKYSASIRRATAPNFKVGQAVWKVRLRDEHFFLLPGKITTQSLSLFI
jgi:hypothetical protein